jgi:hypothetical protein
MKQNFAKVFFAAAVAANLISQAADIVYCKAQGYATGADTWENSLAPQAGLDYAITNNFMVSINGDDTFNWNSLQIGKIPYSRGSDLGKLRMYKNETQTVRFENEGVKLAAGEWYTYLKAIVHVYGKITVLSKSNKPFVIRGDKYREDNGFYFYGSISSDKDAVLDFNTYTNLFTVKLLGDCSAFSGTMNLKTGTYPSGKLFKHDFYVGNTTIPGTVNVSGGVTLHSAATNDFHIGTLSLASNSTLVVDYDKARNTNSVVRVDNSLSIPKGGVTLKFNMGDIDSHLRLPVIDVPKECELELSDFVLDAELSYCNRPQLLIVEDDAAQRKMLIAEFFPVVEMAKNENANQAPLKDYPDQYVIAMKDGSYWEDGKTPHDKAHYIAKYFEKATALHLPYTSSPSIYMFPGRSLAVKANVNLFLPNGSFNCNKLILENGSAVWLSKLCNCEILGPVECMSGTVDLKAWNGCTMTLSGPLNGAATIRSWGGTDTSARSGTLQLACDASGFTGKWNITMNKAGAGTNTLLLGNDGCLGAPLPSFTYDALALSENAKLGIATGVNKVSVSDPTRGVYINGSAQVAAASGKIMKIDSPITYNCVLSKTGEGTLELGGSPRFGAGGTSENPGSSANLQTLKLCAGTLKVNTSDCLNGVDVVVENSSARFVIDAGSQDSTLKTFGLRNTKALTPFSATGSAENFVFEVEASDTVAFPAEFALCTVSVQAAAQLDGKIRAKCAKSLKDLGRVHLSVSKKPADADSVTFMCTAKELGLTVIIK